MSEIRKYFTSRFDDGYIMEFDFSQLEVACLAHLSKDPVLIQDILDGADLHKRSAAQWLGVPESHITEPDRKKAKGMTFQLQYGAGYKSMAAKLGLPESSTKAFIDAYYGRYEVVKQWQDDNIKTVKKNRWMLKEPKLTKHNGYPAGEGLLLSITNRVYRFTEYDAPEWMARKGIITSFSPTEIKNYPVQGFAADIVAHMLGVVWRKLKQCNALKNNALLINTVHDSMVFDVKPEYVAPLHNLVMPILNNTNAYIEAAFDIKLAVPIKADCKLGKNWMDMEDYQIA